MGAERARLTKSVNEYERKCKENRILHTYMKTALFYFGLFSVLEVTFIDNGLLFIAFIDGGISYMFGNQERTEIASCRL